MHLLFSLFTLNNIRIFRKRTAGVMLMWLFPLPVSCCWIWRWVSPHETPLYTHLQQKTAQTHGKASYMHVFAKDMNVTFWMLQKYAARRVFFFFTFVWELYVGKSLCFFQFLHDSFHTAAFTPVQTSSCIYLNVYELWTLQRLCRNCYSAKPFS